MNEKRWWCCNAEYGEHEPTCQNAALTPVRVKADVRLCIAPGCAVAFRGPRETCPCCGGPSEPAGPGLPQPERGAGTLCRECANRGACPPGADLRRVTSGGEADDECCWEYKPNIEISNRQ